MAQNSFEFYRFEDEIFPKWVRQFYRGPNIGDYSYLPGKKVDSYGVTDTLLSKYIINQLNLNEYEKTAWGDRLKSFQDPQTGWFHKDYTFHYKEHTTAYCVAALKLLQQIPLYEFKWKDPILKNFQTMEKWIEHPNWSFIWATSHIISGIPAALLMTNKHTSEFINWYFNWLNQAADPTSGFYSRGIIHRSKIRKTPTKHELGGAFHMYYIYEYCHRSWPYPEKIIDHTLRLQQKNGVWDGNTTYCVDLDGIYSLTRSCRNAAQYRESEVRQAVIKYLQTAERILNTPSYFFSHYGNTHKLTGALSAIAECQKFYPDLVHTRQPWRQSLDEACFI